MLFYKTKTSRMLAKNRLAVSKHRVMFDEES